MCWVLRKKTLISSLLLMTDNKELALYDRQIFTIGFVVILLLFLYLYNVNTCFFLSFFLVTSFSLDAMKKLSASSCLISGMNGAGVEIGLLFSCCYLLFQYLNLHFLLLLFFFSFLFSEERNSVRSENCNSA